MSRRFTRFTGIVFLAAACGGEPSAVAPRPPPPVASAPLPAPPTPARWVFTAPSSAVEDKLDLGAAAMLVVGEHGRREIIRGDTRTDAPTLAPDTFVGILKDDMGRLVFVTGGGDAYVSREPLGELEARRRGPFANAEPMTTITSLARGRAAIMLTSSDGRVLRTSDFGVTWKPVEYAGANRPFGHAWRVALDREGNGVLLHVPQRVFVTHDDGASWTPGPPPAIGARQAVQDADDRVKVTAATPQPPPTRPDVETATVIAGDHVVDLEATRPAGKRGSVVVRTTKLGEKPRLGVVVADLAMTRPIRGRIAGYGPDLIYLRADDADPNAPTSTVVFSSDYGATWKPDATMDGADPPDYDVLVSIGPRGWACVPSLCSLRGEHHERVCSPPRVRVAGGTSFEDMDRTVAFRPLSFTFDDARDKVYAVGDVDGKRAVYESALSRNDFTPTEMSAEQGGWLEPVLSVGPSGTLHVWRYDGDKSAYTAERRDAAGKILPALYLPFRTLSHAGSVAPMVFAGARGALFVGDSFGWETADGGDTWVRVASDGNWTARCSDAGCAGGPTQRIGWDLPARTVADVDRVTAMPKLPEPDKPSPGKPRREPPEPPPLELACKVSAMGAPVEEVPDFRDAGQRNGIRWTQSEGDEKDGRLTMVVGGRTSVRRLPLLGPLPARKPGDKERRWGSHRVDGGLVAARYSFMLPSSPGSIPPVDVELAWFSSATGRAAHATLPRLGGFPVTNPGVTGDVQIVPGGLFFQPTALSPLLFIHDDGTIERMTLPARSTVTDAHRLGSAWLLLDTDPLGTTQLSWSDDAGKSWQQRAWVLSEDSHPRLYAVGNQAWLGVGSEEREEGVGLVPIATPVPDDPPSPVLVDVTGPLDAPCDPKSPWSAPLDIQTERDTVRASVVLGKPATNVQLVARRRIAHFVGVNKLCTSGYSFIEDGKYRHRALLFRDGTGWSGWTFRPAGEKKGLVAEPVTCTASTPP